MQLKATRRSYDANYKSKAIWVAIELNNVMSVARDLGLASTTRKRWDLPSH